MFLMPHIVVYLFRILTVLMLLCHLKKAATHSELFHLGAQTASAPQSFDFATKVRRLAPDVKAYYEVDIDYASA